MGLVKMLQSNEMIYSSVKTVKDQGSIKIAIDSTGNEYFFESNIDDKTMWVNHPCGIRAKVFTKAFKIRLKHEGYVLKHKDYKN